MKRIRAALRRLPIRIKLALIFSGAMAVVLTGSAFFLYAFRRSISTRFLSNQS